VSSDGEDVKRWLPKSPSDTIVPWTLSVTSSRLLVTSRDTKQLRQFDAVGDELSRVDLPRDMRVRVLATLMLNVSESDLGVQPIGKCQRHVDDGDIIDDVT